MHDLVEHSSFLLTLLDKTMLRVITAAARRTANKESAIKSLLKLEKEKKKLKFNSLAYHLILKKYLLGHCLVQFERQQQSNLI